MKMCKIIVVLALIIAAIYFIPRSSKSTGIEQKGRRLSITAGKHRLKANIIGLEISQSFLVIGGSYRGDYHYTAELSVIPLNTAKQLARAYPDFRKCSSPGASAAKRSVQPMLLYAANSGTKRRLRSISRFATAGKEPVVKMTYMEINITNHTMKFGDEEIPVDFRTNIPFFLVKDVQIIEKDRNF